MKNLKEFVLANPKLVSRKESKTYPGLFVLKYSKKVFFDNLWEKSALLRECRGLVVDDNYDVVIRPLTKIFNYGENGTGSTWLDSDKVLVTKKWNGFLGVLTNVKGKLIISTTGSLDSDFVGYANEYLSKITPAMCKEHVSYLFEICHPADPHIIPEKNGAYFLAAVEHDNGLHHYKFDSSILIENAIEDFSGVGIIVEDESPVWNFGELKKHIKTIKHEGYVIVNIARGIDETLKIKSPYYLVNKFFARIGEKKLVDGIKNGTIKQRIDEEYYGLVDKIKELGLDNYVALDERQRLDILTNWIEELQA